MAVECVCPDRIVPCGESQATEFCQSIRKIHEHMDDAVLKRLQDMEGQTDINTGVKYDGGKPPLALLSPAALVEIARVLEFGSKKYAAHNWKGGFAWSRVASALLRHVFAWIGGQDKDSETGLSHLAHAGCCVMFLLDFEVNGLGTDDRYKGKP